MGERRAALLGVGKYAPERVMTNRELEQLVDTSNEWIVERTGIEERHIADPSEAASDLAYKAALQAMAQAGVGADDLDLIICATVTADTIFPSAACRLQALLGASKAAAFDVSAGCTGFIYGLHLAQNLVRVGAHRRILLVGVEVLSRILDWTDRSTCVLLGDGAGAVVIGEATRPNQGILATRIESDGHKGYLLEMPGGGSRRPATEDTVREHLHFFKMNGRETFKNATRLMGDSAQHVLSEQGMGLGEVDLLIPHQANLRIITALAKSLELPMERVVTNVQHYGNTSSASIPIALSEAQEQGRLHEGMAIMMVAFGAGLTWGTALLRW